MSAVFEIANGIPSSSGDEGNSTSFNYGEGDDSHNPNIGVLVLSVFALAINLVLFVPTYLVRRRRLQRQRESRAARQLYLANAAFGGAKPEDRYTKIESWVVSKQICAHDELCSKVCKIQKLDTKPRLRKQTASTVESAAETEEDEEMCHPCSSSDGSESGEPECPICFDTFEVDDVASWSADPACGHVFHHRCIKEWLLKKDGCPFCRETFLPCDIFGGTRNFKQLSELLEHQENRSLHSFYCIDHGIVSLPKNAEELLDPDDWAKVSQRAQEVPDRSFLLQMRGPISHDDDGDEEKDADQEVTVTRPPTDNVDIETASNGPGNTGDDTSSQQHTNNGGSA